MPQQRFDDPKTRLVPRVQAKIEGQSMTKQSFTEESDINRIVARATETGFISSMTAKQGLYADVTDVPDFQSAMNVVVAAERRFMELPAQVRERFHNDPAEILEFVKHEHNRAEAERLGFLQPKPKPVVEPAKPAEPDPKPKA